MLPNSKNPCRGLFLLMNVGILATVLMAGSWSLADGPAPQPQESAKPSGIPNGRFHLPEEVKLQTLEWNPVIQYLIQNPQHKKAQLPLTDMNGRKDWTFIVERTMSPRHFNCVSRYRGRNVSVLPCVLVE